MSNSIDGTSESLPDDQKSKTYGSLSDDDKEKYKLYLFIEHNIPKDSNVGVSPDTFENFYKYFKKSEYFNLTLNDLKDKGLIQKLEEWCANKKAPSRITRFFYRRKTRKSIACKDYTDTKNQIIILYYIYNENHERRWGRNPFYNSIRTQTEDELGFDPKIFKSIEKFKNYARSINEDRNLLKKIKKYLLKQVYPDLVPIKNERSNSVKSARSDSVNSARSVSYSMKPFRPSVDSTASTVVMPLNDGWKELPDEELPDEKLPDDYFESQNGGRTRRRRRTRRSKMPFNVKQVHKHSRRGRSFHQR